MERRQPSFHFEDFPAGILSAPDLTAVPAAGAALGPPIVASGTGGANINCSMPCLRCKLACWLAKVCSLQTVNDCTCSNTYVELGLGAGIMSHRQSPTARQLSTQVTPCCHPDLSLSGTFHRFMTASASSMPHLLLSQVCSCSMQLTSVVCCLLNCLCPGIGRCAQLL